MATLDHVQLEGLWITAGGFSDAADTAAAIAQAESGGVSTKINNTAYPSRPGYHLPSPGAQKEYSVGLWQINLLAHPSYTEAEMLKPLFNAEAAVAISSDGNNFGAWTTFTHGTYSQYLQAGGTPTSQQGSTAALTAAGVAPSGHAGWGDVRNSVNRHLPTQLARSQALRHAALRELSSRPRLGR